MSDARRVKRSAGEEVRGHSEQAGHGLVGMREASAHRAARLDAGPLDEVVSGGRAGPIDGAP